MKDLLPTGRLLVLLLIVAFCAWLLSLAITAGLHHGYESRFTLQGWLLGFMVAAVIKRAKLRARVGLGVGAIALALLGATGFLHFADAMPSGGLFEPLAYAGAQGLLTMLLMSIEGPLVHPLFGLFSIVPPGLMLWLDDPKYGLSTMLTFLLGAVILTGRSMFEQQQSRLAS